jgi:cysteinyl-tRNA synthetase
MKIYNVLNRKKEKFRPLDAEMVKIYACGITVNGDAHLGHARQAIIFNMITEYFRYAGYKVKYVRNYTDIDDKIIDQAKALHIDPLELSRRRIAETDAVMKKILTNDADVKPRVSDYIGPIILFVQKLIEKDCAYVTPKGDVYYSVKKFPQYGKLSNRKVEDLISAVRIDENEEKRDYLDFTLWKSVGPEDFGWDSPWGKGRPGWHIECSTMIYEILGQQIDIHGGGRDLIFPHHENEIAQSEALNNCQLAQFWIHNGLITVNGQKMGKSLNNFITINDLLENYHPEVIRFFILSHHYSSPLDLTYDQLEIAERNLYYFNISMSRYRKYINAIEAIPPEESDNNVLSVFETCMRDDFNISKFISELFVIFTGINREKKAEVKQSKIMTLFYALEKLYPILGMFGDSGEFIKDAKEKYLSLLCIKEKEILELIQVRKEAKSNKDYFKSDEIRNDLLNRGILLMDTAGEIVWDIKSLYSKT